jgi:hypothetical protein
MTKMADADYGLDFEFQILVSLVHVVAFAARLVAVGRLVWDVEAFRMMVRW